MVLHVMSIILMIFVKLATSDFVVESRPTSDEPLIVPPLCTPCECVKVGTILAADCSDRNLKSIPMNLPPDIVSLNLEGNNLKNVDYNANGLKGICSLYKDLKSISLAHTSLTSLASIVTGCAATLEELDLTGNNLTIDTVEVFPHLRNLVALKGLTVRAGAGREYFRPIKNLRHLKLVFDGSSFPADLFSELQDVRILHLEVTKAWELDAVLEIPVLDQLYLRGPRVGFMSKSFFSKLGNLTLLDLDLPRLNAVEWQEQALFSSLKHLSINGVMEVRAATISGIKTLQTLQLRGIFNLRDQDLFQRQNMLEVLEITDSRIRELPSSWFSGLSSLCDLNLAHNGIGQLNSDSLLGLSNLRNLILSGNEIQDIPPDFLRPVVDNLENLSLNGNRLVEFGDEDLPRMKTLMALDLSENNLAELNLKIFSNTPTLVHLQVQNNQIRQLSGPLYTGLQRVNVSHNLLQEVPGELMVDSMMDLDISANPIGQELPVSKILKLEHFKELTINGLVVNCDCEMRELVGSKIVHGGQCFGASHLGRVSDIVYDESISCESEESTMSKLSDDGIIERALDGVRFESPKENNEVGDEGISDMTKSAVESSPNTNASPTQEDNEEGDEGISNMTKSGVESSPNTNASPTQEDNEEGVESSPDTNALPTQEDNEERDRVQYEALEHQTNGNNSTMDSRNVGIENKVGEEMPEIQGAGQDSYVENNTKKIQTTPTRNTNGVDMIFSHLLTVGDAMQEHIYKEGDTEVKEHKDNDNLNDSVSENKNDGADAEDVGTREITEDLNKEQEDDTNDATFNGRRYDEERENKTSLNTALANSTDQESDDIADRGDIKDTPTSKSNPIVLTGTASTSQTNFTGPQNKSSSHTSDHVKGTSPQDEASTDVQGSMSKDCVGFINETASNNSVGNLKTCNDSVGSMDDSVGIVGETTSNDRMNSSNDNFGLRPVKGNVSNDRTVLSNHSVGCYNHIMELFNQRVGTVKETASDDNVGGSVKGTAASKNGTDTSSSDEDDEDLRMIAVVVIVVVVIGFIGCVCVFFLIRRMRRSGSHDLDHTRKKVARHGELNETLMVMTELGKSQLGQEVVVM